MRTILVIDDDHGPVDYYVEVLQRSYKVIHIETSHEGLEFLRTNGSDINMVILDMVMPSESASEAEASGWGMGAGLLFLRRAKDVLSRHRIPVIILSNIGTETPGSQETKSDGICVTQLAKFEYTPCQLASVVDDIFAGFRK